MDAVDLMTGSATYAGLLKKYDGFRAPTVHIKAEGTDLDRVFGARVTDLSVDLTAGFEASGCAFNLLGEYEPRQSGFDPKGASALLQLGAKVEVAVGYVRTETVFRGIVMEVEYRFDEDNAPYLHVECVDAKCLLMKTRRIEVMLRKNISDAVGEMLSARPVSDYLSGREVAPMLGDKDTPIYDMMGSDYDFLVKNARMLGCEFFIIQGKAYFRRPPAAAMPLMTLSPGKGLLSARLALRGGGLVEKVSVSGLNPQNGEAVRGSFSLRGRFSKGVTAARMLASTEQSVFDASISSPAAATAYAKTLGQALKNGFGTLECTCLGIPELAPGRYVRLTGLMPEANREFYVTGVRHEVGPNGFQTSIEARVDGL